MLAGKRILLGVTGSIAAYQAADLIGLLKNQFASVRVIMTRSASRFFRRKVQPPPTDEQRHRDPGARFLQLVRHTWDQVRIERIKLPLQSDLQSLG